MRELVEHYERCFEKHGDTAKGFDWPTEEDANRRYQVMLDVINYGPEIMYQQQPSFLDFACGTGKLLEYLTKNQHCVPRCAHPDYIGVDLSEKFIKTATNKFPATRFIKCDIDVPKEYECLPVVDYLVCNGLFTLKANIFNFTMGEFFKKTVSKFWNKVNIGVAFNVMDLEKVDKIRNDLFYQSYSDIGNLMRNLKCKNYIIRQNYGLYEFTVYMYK